MGKQEFYCYPDHTGREKKIIKKVMNGDGVITALNQPVNDLPERSLQRIKVVSLTDFRYFRTAGTQIREGGSSGTKEELEDTIPYAYWRKRNG